MRYLIADFEEKTITWKDTLVLDPSCVDEGGSEAFSSNVEFIETLAKDVDEAGEALTN